MGIYDDVLNARMGGKPVVVASRYSQKWYYISLPDGFLTFDNFKEAINYAFSQ